MTIELLWDDGIYILSRLFELRAQDPGPVNYPIAVFSEWRGKAFYLNVRYRARSGHRVPS